LACRRGGRGRLDSDAKGVRGGDGGGVEVGHRGRQSAVPLGHLAVAARGEVPHQVVARAPGAREVGQPRRQWVLEADIEACFDNRQTSAALATSRSSPPDSTEMRSRCCSLVLQLSGM